MPTCQDSCPKLKPKSRSSQTFDKPKSYTADGSSYNEDPNDGTKSPRKGGKNNHRNPSPRLRSVQIGGVTSVEGKDSQTTKNSVEERKNLIGKNNRSDSGRSGVQKSGEKTSPQVQKVEKKELFHDQKISQGLTGSGTSRNQIKQSPQRSFQRPTTNTNTMSSRSRNSPSRRRGEDTDWDSTGHSPCVSNCPKAKAKDRAFKKAQLRQERLDNYLLTKGFSYFDDLCTCSSICLFNQLRKDKFVLDFLKSACLFGIGMKLCEELDAWNLFG